MKKQRSMRLSCSSQPGDLEPREQRGAAEAEVAAGDDAPHQRGRTRRCTSCGRRAPGPLLKRHCRTAVSTSRSAAYPASPTIIAKKRLKNGRKTQPTSALPVAGVDVQEVEHRAHRGDPARLLQLHGHVLARARGPRTGGPSRARRQPLARRPASRPAGSRRARRARRPRPCRRGPPRAGLVGRSRRTGRGDGVARGGERVEALAGVDEPGSQAASSSRAVGERARAATGTSSKWPPRSGSVSGRSPAPASREYRPLAVAPELGEHHAVRRREPLVRRRRPRGSVHTPPRSRRAHLVEVELAEAVVPGELPRSSSARRASASRRSSSASTSATAALGVRRAPARAASSAPPRLLRQGGERPLRRREAGAQRVQVLAGRRPAVGHVHHAEPAQRVQRLVPVRR